MPSPAPPTTADSPIVAVLSTLRDIYSDKILPRLPTPLQTASESLGPVVASSLQSGDIVSLAAFLLAVYLTLRIADYIRRSIFAWIAFVLKVALVLAAVQAVLYAQRYGWDKTVADAAWLAGLVWKGFLEEIFDPAAAAAAATSTSGAGANAKWNLSGGRQQVPAGSRAGYKRQR